MQKFNYTYKVTKIDIMQGTFVVEYTPEDSTLPVISYNTYLYEPPVDYFRDEEGAPIYTDIEEIPFEKKFQFCVESAAPHDQWNRQKQIYNNVEFLQSKM